MKEIDVIDETIMKMVLERASLKEMAEIVGRSKGGIKLRLKNLQDEGYVLPPPKPGMARSYRLTGKGRDYMQEKGYI